MAMFNSILVVCAGNICRSPTAEYILKNLLVEKQLTISSAGLTALEQHQADATAQEVALEDGIEMTAHRGRQISDSLIAQNDLILVMEQKHLDDLCSRYPQARGKTFLLGKWINDMEIPDPYRQQRPAFEHVYQLIKQACSAWQKYL